MLMNTAVTVVCWKRKRRVRWDGTTGGDKPRRAIELPREAPSSTFPILREPAATVFNKVPVVVVCCFRKKCLIAARKVPALDRIEAYLYGNRASTFWSS